MRSNYNKDKFVVYWNGLDWYSGTLVIYMQFCKWYSSENTTPDVSLFWNFILKRFLYCYRNISIQNTLYLVRIKNHVQLVDYIPKKSRQNRLIYGHNSIVHSAAHHPFHSPNKYMYIINVKVAKVLWN